MGKGGSIDSNKYLDSNKQNKAIIARAEWNHALLDLAPRAPPDTAICH